MAKESSTPPPARPPKRGCLRRLVVTTFLLGTGFFFGWVLNEAEDQEWDAGRTCRQVTSRAKLLWEKLRALTESEEASSENTPDTAPPEKTPSDEIPLEDSQSNPDQSPETSRPHPPETEKPTSLHANSSDMTKGDEALHSALDLIQKARNAKTGREDTRLAAKAEKKLREAIRYYERALKKNPDSRHLQKQMEKASTQLYWSKKLQRAR